MIQEKVKTQIDQIKKQGGKLQGQLNKSLESAKVEGQRILKELGVEVKPGKIDVNALLIELRKANPSIKAFIRNLDVATYDNRFRLNWNATMISAYAKQQAEKTYATEVKPMLLEVKASMEEQLKEVQSKTQEFAAKIRN